MFAFDAKPEPAIKRNESGRGLNAPTSDNAELRSLRLCTHCRQPFRFAYAAQRFCGHACYNASLRRPIGPRFWAKVNKHGPIHPRLGTRCWVWQGAVTGSGPVKHGQVMWRERYATPQKAHRIAWELERGPIPANLQINHHCDNPICCRVDGHLYLGTQDENMKDAARRNRLTVPRDGVLSLYDRLTIYHAPRYRGADVALASQFGVTKTTIHHIRRGRFLGSGVWHGTKTDPSLAQFRAERTPA